MSNQGVTTRKRLAQWIRHHGSVFLALVLALWAFVPFAEAAPATNDTFCGTGQLPEFHFGFETLSETLGQTMGVPTECEHDNATNGDTVQRTSMGLSFYRKFTNTPTFTDGFNHYAQTAQGLVTWTGSAVDPPCALPGGLPFTSPYHDLTISCSPDGQRYHVNVYAPWTAAHANSVVREDAHAWFDINGIDRHTAPIDYFAPCGWPTDGTEDTSTLVSMADASKCPTS